MGSSRPPTEAREPPLPARPRCHTCGSPSRTLPREITTPRDEQTPLKLKGALGRLHGDACRFARRCSRMGRWCRYAAGDSPFEHRGDEMKANVFRGINKFGIEEVERPRA